jgi:hypothetical protein
MSPAFLFAITLMAAMGPMMSPMQYAGAPIDYASKCRCTHFSHTAHNFGAPRAMSGP